MAGKVTVQQTLFPPSTAPTTSATTGASLAPSPKLQHKRTGSDIPAAVFDDTPPAVAASSSLSSDAPPPLPPAHLLASDLPRFCRSWPQHWGLDVACALISPDWTQRHQALVHVGLRLDQLSSAASEQFESLCEIMEHAISDPVPKVLQAGLRLVAALPVRHYANHPRLVRVLEHVVFCCHAPTQRVR